MVCLDWETRQWFLPASFFFDSIIINIRLWPDSLESSPNQGCRLHWLWKLLLSNSCSNHRFFSFTPSSCPVACLEWKGKPGCHSWKLRIGKNRDAKYGQFCRFNNKKKEGILFSSAFFVHHHVFNVVLSPDISFVPVLLMSSRMTVIYPVISWIIMSSRELRVRVLVLCSCSHCYDHVSSNVPYGHILHEVVKKALLKRLDFFDHFLCNTRYAQIYLDSENIMIASAE